MAPSTCTDCGGDDFVESDGSLVCTGCGLIGDRIVSHSAPWINNEPPAPFAAINPVKRSRHVTSKEKWKARLTQLADMAGLIAGVKETALSVYEQATELPDWKNRKSDYQVGVLVACMFHACNIHKCHRTPLEICATIGTDPRNARRMVKVTERAALIVASRRSMKGTDVATEIIPRCACRIDGVPESKIKQVRRLAITYYNKVRDSVDNHRPDTIAAGILSVVFKSAGVRVKDAHIAAACLVAPNTVRSVSKRISSTLGLD